MARTILVLLFAAAACWPSALATGRGDKPLPTREYLLNLTRSSRPAVVDDAGLQSFDCAWRKLAMKYAPTIQHLDEAHQRMVHEALELRALCNETFAPAVDAAGANVAPAARTSVAGDPNSVAVYVDAGKGSDANPGTITEPLKTIAAAVALTRRRGTAGAAKTVYLRAGTYHLAATVVLTGADSGLTVSAYRSTHARTSRRRGEEAIVSGGRVLGGLRWTPTSANARVFEADVPRGWGAIPALHVGGRRATLARFPNANPEVDIFPVGYITAPTTWTPPVEYQAPHAVCNPAEQCGKSDNWTIPVTDAWHGMFQNWTKGVGGACARYENNASVWCSGDFYRLRQFPEMHTRSPSGLTYTPSLLPHAPYAAGGVGARVHAWRPGHWYTWMFEVASDAKDSATFKFDLTKGGDQGGEGNERASEWFIEGVKEELDAPNEFFFDAATRTLHFRPNGTSGGPPDATVVVPTLATLISVNGSRAAPAVNISLSGLTFTASRPTYMEPRTNPSGGDWSLEREGAVRLENSEGAAVHGCYFTRLDSNAISING